MLLLREEDDGWAVDEKHWQLEHTTIHPMA
jgi:hypothetical protein